ncbi:MAG: RidA family protein [Mycobacterium sp.]
MTGQMPTGAAGSLVGRDVAIQTDQVLRNLEPVTELCGGTLSDVVQVRAYLIDWNDYDAFTRHTPRGFGIDCRRVPASASAAWRSRPSSRSTGCAGAVPAGHAARVRDVRARSAWPRRAQRTSPGRPRMRRRT